MSLGFTRTVLIRLLSKHTGGPRPQNKWSVSYAEYCTEQDWAWVGQGFILFSQYSIVHLQLISCAHTAHKYHRTPQLCIYSIPRLTSIWLKCWIYNQTLSICALCARSSHTGQSRHDRIETIFFSIVSFMLWNSKASRNLDLGTQTGFCMGWLLRNLRKLGSDRALHGLFGYFWADKGGRGLINSNL